jgi:glycosyltransferase involved in cell wall biosynthesis
MKIVHIIPTLKKGGAERLVLTICNELNNFKIHKVLLITFHPDNEYSYLTNEIDWQVISSVYVPSLLGKPQINVAQLQRVIQEFDPDIIHTHLWEAEIISRQIIFPKAKWFSHFHDNMKQLETLNLAPSKESITNYYEKLLITKKYRSHNNYFICISNDTVKYAKKTLPKKLKENIHYLPNAIDFERFSNAEKVKGSKSLKLINIGSLVRKKNQIFLIAVIEILLKKSVNVELVILGDGPLKKDLKKEIQEKKLENNIFLNGNVNNPEYYLWNSDLYVHSATYEPFGLVLLEAMAAGLPVITLNGKGNKDIIKQGQNGFILDNENPQLFAEKIVDVWDNRELHNSLGAYASTFAKKYDIKKYIGNLLMLYKKTLLV